MQTVGSSNNISARYTDTASFQAMQYGINVAASLVSNIGWNLAAGNTGHLDSMRQEAGKEAVRLAAFHISRRYRTAWPPDNRGGACQDFPGGPA